MCSTERGILDNVRSISWIASRDDREEVDRALGTLLPEATYAIPNLRERRLGASAAVSWDERPRTRRDCARSSQTLRQLRRPGWPAHDARCAQCCRARSRARSRRRRDAAGRSRRRSRDPSTLDALLRREADRRAPTAHHASRRYSGARRARSRRDARPRMRRAPPSGCSSVRAGRPLDAGSQRDVARFLGAAHGFAGNVHALRGHLRTMSCAAVSSRYCVSMRSGTATR